MPDASGSNPRGTLPSVSSSLLQGVQEMRPEAWSRLVAVFSPIVYRWVRTSGVNGSDAADVVQEVFIAIAGNIQNFERQRDQGSFRSWLATITRNRVRDLLRRRKNRPVALGGTGAWQQWQNHPDNRQGELSDLDRSISVADLGQRIPHLVLQLIRDDCEPQTWKAFWETTVMGDGASDVAARLGISVTSVYQAKSRILRRIRKRLEELP